MTFVNIIKSWSTKFVLACMDISSSNILSLHQNLVVYCHLPLIVNIHCLILSLSIVKSLVRENQCSIVTTDEDGNTPLHLAAKYGQVEVADYLIDAGAEVDARCVCVCVCVFCVCV